MYMVAFRHIRPSQASILDPTIGKWVKTRAGGDKLQVFGDWSMSFGIHKLNQ